MVTHGTLFGVGVGPGDPELMTVKAWRLVSTCQVITYLSANGGESMARSIATPFIPEDVIEVPIDVPMRAEREPAQAAYDAGCVAISAHLDQGRDVVALCEGDPFFYGSFMYIFSRLSKRYQTCVVPGVSSLMAAAAAVGRPLAARNEVIKVLPATLDAGRLRDELLSAESVAIIKVGRHFSKIRNLLGGLDLVSRSVAVERATGAEERITPVAEIQAESLPYFTTILVYTGKEQW